VLPGGTDDMSIPFSWADDQRRQS